MTKYTKDALINYLINLVIAVSTGMFLALSATLFGLDKVILGLAIAVFFYCSYKYVKIQAEINERLDKLNNK
ncbi:hypothetical protein UFOVP112_398 [uncultured Caudovirales phage]|uniref:Uncharacterized protein n=1 Tax=uncultured Caudovirales phage TaxID=2100421 RepID=A0A6J5L962_9CAUD|nr:hypothetical protein UFOVP112_398 [uncultured Caudovirales phage]